MPGDPRRCVCVTPAGTPPEPRARGTLTAAPQASPAGGGRRGAPRSARGCWLRVGSLGRNGEPGREQTGVRRGGIPGPARLPPRRGLRSPRLRGWKPSVLFATWTVRRRENVYFLLQILLSWAVRSGPQHLDQTPGCPQTHTFCFLLGQNGQSEVVPGEHPPVCVAKVFARLVKAPPEDRQGATPGESGPPTTHFQPHCLEPGLREPHFLLPLSESTRQHRVTPDCSGPALRLGRTPSLPAPLTPRRPTRTRHTPHTADAAHVTHATHHTHRTLHTYTAPMHHTHRNSPHTQIAHTTLHSHTLHTHTTNTQHPTSHTTHSTHSIHTPQNTTHNCTHTQNTQHTPYTHIPHTHHTHHLCI